MKDFFTVFAILWGGALCWADEGIFRPHTCLTCLESDLSSDCRVNLADFAQMASGWLQTKNLSNLGAMASQWLSAVPTVGAQPPYREYEAEQANSNGILIGPNRTYLTPASEASGRQAVKLVNVGHYVEFTLLEPANAMVLRFSIPGPRIRAFEAAAGVSQTVSESLEKEKNRSFDDFPEVKKVFDNGFSKVEFWVFIDGKLVYRQEQTSTQEGCSIRIPLAQTDRFLTLAVTESDDTIAYDWALFAHPQLILESAGEL